MLFAKQDNKAFARESHAAIRQGVVPINWYNTLPFPAAAYAALYAAYVSGFWKKLSSASSMSVVNTMV